MSNTINYYNHPVKAIKIENTMGNSLRSTFTGFTSHDCEKGERFMNKNSNFVFVEKTLSNIASELIEVNTLARSDRFDWMENERGIDLSLIDKENSIEEYLETKKERLDYIANRKRELINLAGGMPERCKGEYREEYKSLLMEERWILQHVEELEFEIDSSFKEEEEYIYRDTANRRMTDMLKISVDTMSIDELDKTLEMLQLMYEDGLTCVKVKIKVDGKIIETTDSILNHRVVMEDWEPINYRTWVELSLVCLSRARYLVSPQKTTTNRNGLEMSILKDPQAGYEEEYQKFLNMYQGVQHREDSALPFYEHRERQYLTENEIISYLDGEVELDWDDMNPIGIIMNEHTKVLDALIGTKGNKSAAGRLLGVSPRTINRRLVKAAEAAREAKIA